ncbi:P-loop containing nucleoside triphosphate hydrolase protein [Cyathus striatus]|nr:P-loop containing nucleoside triphosphate hydrolase protein [Cyathus striatus]
MLTGFFSRSSLAYLLHPSSIMASEEPSGRKQITDKRSHAKSHLRKLKWGIFEVAYERPESLFSRSTVDYIYSCRIPAHYTLRFLKELANIAPSSFFLHIACCLYLSISPALSLYFAHAILAFGQKLIFTRDINDYDRVILLLFVCMWIISALLSSAIQRTCDDNRLCLGGHLRCHFLPRFAHASLEADMSFIQDYKLQGALPRPWSFSDGAPGLDIFTELFTRATNLLTVVFELLVLVYIISQKATSDSYILLFLSLFCLIITVICPSNGTEGAGYIFWTKNPHFYRLSALHLIVFDPSYRETLAKDGLCEHLYYDYKRTTESLGIVKSDTFTLAWNYPCPWYWELTRSLIADYPMAMYAVTLPWRFSNSSLATMALFQYGMNALRQSAAQCLTGPAPLRDTFVRAQTLYTTLSYVNPSHTGTVKYPHPTASSLKGMKISFRDVCVRYEGIDNGNDILGAGLEAVKSATFDIKPGQLVVITGINGSGKSSLLKLIPRLNNPSSGSILIDDHPFENYSLLQFRKSIAYLSQNEEIYPVSLRENVLMGVTGSARQLAQTNDTLLENAVDLGGARKLVDRLGWDAVIKPPSLMGYSVQHAGFGSIGKSAVEELDRNSPSCKPIEISGGERQRLLCSRTFMKIMNNDLRLIVVDEPTSALDPIAERDILQNILEFREGKTVIFVSHRFGNLVKHADLILCMNDGVIVEQGTHESLVRHVGGQYANLYKAQCEDI